jgi:hypothetical protein
MRHFGVLGLTGVAVAIVVLVGHHERSASRDDELSTFRDEVIRADRAMRDRPPTITDLTVDGITYPRTGKLEPAIESLATAVAAMGRPANRVGPFVARHCLAFVWAPPAGSSFRSDFEIGEVDANGCAAKQGGELVSLPRAICEDVAAIGAGFTPGVTTCASAEMRALVQLAR